ncbi:MAG: 50S ribosomal protein L9 [Bacteroidia bacterium]|jgi:large subunit ribosomal protein L9
MKIILKQDVKNLGYKDDVVNVKNGYANNFLLPGGYAVMASGSNLRILEENLKQGVMKRAKLKQDAEGLAANLNGLSITITTKAGANGKIFGSITALQIAQELKNKGFEVDRRKIDFNEEIKNLGNYKAKINLHKEVKAEVAVEVVAE